MDIEVIGWTKKYQIIEIAYFQSSFWCLNPGKITMELAFQTQTLRLFCVGIFPVGSFFPVHPIKYVYFRVWICVIQFEYEFMMSDLDYTAAGITVWIQWEPQSQW